MRTSTVGLGLCLIVWVWAKVADLDSVLLDQLVIAMVGLWVSILAVDMRKSKPAELLADWCQGCGHTITRKHMAFTETGLYRCKECRLPAKEPPKPLPDTKAQYTELRADDVLIATRSDVPDTYHMDDKGMFFKERPRPTQLELEGFSELRGDDVG